MEVKTRTGLVVHGIGIGGNAANVGYSAPLLASLESLVEDRPQAYAFKLVEGMWADEAQAFASLDSLKAAELALAAAWGGPVAVAVIKALELFGMPTGASIVDLVADVIAYSGEGRKPIKAAVRKAIEAHPGCVLIGHSMGTVISCDVITDMIEERLFEGPRDTWPVSSLQTCGSPLGTVVPLLTGIGYTDRARRLEQLEHVPAGFVWRDAVDIHDPVASGSLWNNVNRNNLERFPGYGRLNVNTVTADTGCRLGSHNGYCRNKQVAQSILGLMTREYYP